MGRLHPAAKAFRQHVLREFAFLQSEFGFGRGTRVKGNDFRIDFVNATTRIIVEGINWGSRGRVAFSSMDATVGVTNFDLLDLVSIRRPASVPDDPRELGNQLEQLAALARLLRECGEEVLRGDFEIAPRIRELQQQRLEAWHREEALRGRPRPTRPLPET